MNKHIMVLKQAEYHLKNMEKKIKDSSFDEFQFELNSFIQSARNVTFAMQKEYKNNQKFEDWYLEKQKEMAKDPVFNFFKEKRNSVVKEGTKGSDSFKFVIENELTFKEQTEVVGFAIPSDLLINPKSRIIVRTANRGEIPMDTKDIIQTPIFQEFNQRPVIGVCQEYFEKLYNLSKEFINIDKITNPSSSS